jgi:putative transposase
VRRHFGPPRHDPRAAVFDRRQHERLNKEIKRRTRVATLFPNEASLLRLASAVLSEISDDWETERAYLTMEAR